MKHELTSTVNESENFNLDNFVSIFIEDDDDIFPEFEIREDVEKINDTILLEE